MAGKPMYAFLMVAHSLSSEKLSLPFLMAGVFSLGERVID